jgi:hypothetical protein
MSKSDIKNGAWVLLKQADQALYVSENVHGDGNLIMAQVEKSNESCSFLQIENQDRDNPYICGGDKVLLRVQNGNQIAEKKGKLFASRSNRNERLMFCIVVENSHGKPIKSSTQVALLDTRLLPDHKNYLATSDGTVTMTENPASHKNAIFKIISVEKDIKQDQNKIIHDEEDPDNENIRTSDSIGEENKQKQSISKSRYEAEDQRGRIQVLVDEAKSSTNTFEQEVTRNSSLLTLELSELKTKLDNQVLEARLKHRDLLSMVYQCKKIADRCTLIKNENERLSRLSEQKIAIDAVLKKLKEDNLEIVLVSQAEDKLSEYISNLNERLSSFNDTLSIRTQNTISQLDANKAKIIASAKTLKDIKLALLDSVNEYNKVSAELTLHIDANRQVAETIDGKNSVKNMLDNAGDLLKQSDALLKDILNRIDIDKNSFKEKSF